jgi:hypothetical protein
VCGDVGEPSLWLEDRLDQETCYVESGCLHTIGADCVMRAKAPQYKKSDKNFFVSATSMDEYVLGLSSDNSLDIFEMKDDILTKVVSVGLICPCCGIISRDSNDFKKHSRIHKEAPVECDRCKKTFDKIEHKDHVKNCIYYCPWRGDGCVVTNTRKAKHEAHIRQHKRQLNPEDYEHMDV